ncbi:MAG: 2-C-methyl-D-erythritol 4-phosphate cytidylyltransferase [Bacteroidia bacterium]
MQDFHVIVVAGGSGSRMKSVLPKQFLTIAGKPLLMYTLEQFSRVFPQIEPILVLPANHHATWKKLVEEFSFEIKHHLVEGGESRFHSVKNGLANIPSGMVAIHDGVRPFVSADTIKRVFSTASEKGNAIPVISLKDSIRKIDAEGKSLALNREDYVLVQTPQCFRVSEMKLAFQQNYSEHFTDCASVMESAGYSMNLVEGNTENIKITTPEDLQYAEMLYLSGSNSSS